MRYKISLDLFLIYVCFYIEADIGEVSAESNLLATICNYSNNSVPGVFPYLTELLDNFEVIISCIIP